MMESVIGELVEEPITGGALLTHLPITHVQERPITRYLCPYTTFCFFEGPDLMSDAETIRPYRHGLWAG